MKYVANFVAKNATFLSRIFIVFETKGTVFTRFICESSRRKLKMY